MGTGAAGRRRQYWQRPARRAPSWFSRKAFTPTATPEMPMTEDGPRAATAANAASGQLCCTPGQRQKRPPSVLWPRISSGRGCAWPTRGSAWCRESWPASGSGGGQRRAPHSFTYVPDLAAAMIRAAALPETWNSVLHAPTNPALTQRELAGAFAAAAGVPLPQGERHSGMGPQGGWRYFPPTCASWLRPCTSSRSRSSWTPHAASNCWD